MNILVLNGSPKGEYSITLQTVRYLEKLHPEHVFDVLHVGQRIRTLEKDMQPALDKLKAAELILFSYPVYTFIAPYQLHRFIELVKESGVDLRGKWATQLSTSKHFYDITAHRYIQDNCADLGLNYVRGLSADMDDLLCGKGQKEAREFFAHVLWCMENGVHEEPSAEAYECVHQPVTVPEAVGEKDGDIAVVTNCAHDDTQLQRMIDRFCAVSKRKVRVINIADYPFKGGCLGCFNCAVSGKCIYKDGFDEYLRQTIQTAQAIVYAFTIKDHSFGASFKLYDDRQFCNGHRTVTMGMPMAYLISGAYSRETNVQTVVEARAQVGGNHLAGVATDEHDPNAAIDRVAASLEYALENAYVPPQNFYGIGGMKVFRDLIWLMQGMMKADHRFYKAHGQYDFPQKKWPTMLKMYLVGFLLSSPKLKSKMGNAMNEGMIAPYRKVLERVNGDIVI
ncbi:MAG: NAD(P)H-dependent oxidoreductase [bacterium]|nr:NAD(P)H-dependent oxidoreductase [bacterium]